MMGRALNDHSLLSSAGAMQLEVSGIGAGKSSRAADIMVFERSL
jgi:hypothetical protein